LFSSLIFELTFFDSAFSATWRVMVAYGTAAEEQGDAVAPRKRRTLTGWVGWRGW